MNKENIFLKIINETISDNSYLGDDCAFLGDYGLLVSHDSLVEDIHFSLSYFTPEELGKKSVLVNISDIISGGGVPKFITISLSGKFDENFIKNFYEGVDDICKKYKIKVIGGDLTGGKKITVSVSIIGDVKNRKISSRKNAQIGDVVFLKGYHGHSAFGLKLLLEGKKDKNNLADEEFILAHKEPALYPEFAEKISKNAKHPFAMMDTSDGLYDSLEKISNASKVGFEIEYDKIPTKIKDRNLVLFGGEDFGLLVCLNPKDAYLAEGAAEIGKVCSGNKILIDNQVFENLSFNHF